MVRPPDDLNGAPRAPRPHNQLPRLSIVTTLGPPVLQKHGASSRPNLQTFLSTSASAPAADAPTSERSSSPRPPTPQPPNLPLPLGLPPGRRRSSLRTFHSPSACAPDADADLQHPRPRPPTPATPAPLSLRRASTVTAEVRRTSQRRRFWSTPVLRLGPCALLADRRVRIRQGGALPNPPRREFAVGGSPVGRAYGPVLVPGGGWGPSRPRPQRWLRRLMGGPEHASGHVALVTIEEDFWPAADVADASSAMYVQLPLPEATAAEADDYGVRPMQNRFVGGHVLYASVRPGGTPGSLPARPSSCMSSTATRSGRSHYPMTCRASKPSAATPWSWAPPRATFTSPRWRWTAGPGGSASMSKPGRARGDPEPWLLSSSRRGRSPRWNPRPPDPGGWRGRLGAA